MVVAEIFGPDGLIVIAVLAVVLLFGGAKLPKLARSLGSAKGEFEKGLKEGAKAEEDDKDEPKGSPKAIERGADSAANETKRDETTA
ncbi:MAG TPA: twin-arginine translocase TatA/TatE family subunit [Acidimicrobiales bacterium]|nr:twin-arginine translocase TatA/TatE family subunit [Acidimicrobiales bacterium]